MHYDYFFNWILSQILFCMRTDNDLTLEQISLLTDSMFTCQTIYKYEHNISRIKFKELVDICNATNTKLIDVLSIIKFELIHFQKKVEEFESKLRGDKTMYTDRVNLPYYEYENLLYSLDEKENVEEVRKRIRFKLKRKKNIAKSKPIKKTNDLKFKVNNTSKLKDSKDSNISKF